MFYCNLIQIPHHVEMICVGDAPLSKLLFSIISGGSTTEKKIRSTTILNNWSVTISSVKSKIYLVEFPIRHNHRSKPALDKTFFISVVVMAIYRVLETTVLQKNSKLNTIL